MSLVRGIGFGVLMCVLAMFLFFTLLGGASYFAVKTGERALVREMDKGIDQSDQSPEMKEIYRQNTRAMTHEALFGEHKQRTTAEIEADNAKVAQMEKERDRQRVYDEWVRNADKARQAESH